MSDVFISYARQDEAIARRVATALQHIGIAVWWDADLPAHRAYSEVIEARLTEAKAVVVLWSDAAAKSQWVRAEADFARTAGKLVQAQLDGGLPPMPFNQIQTANLKGWRGGKGHAGWSKLESSVRAMLGGDAAPLAAASPRRWWQAPQARWLAAAGALLLLLAAFLIPRYFGGDPDKKPVVAVLPFESLDRRDESLVAGIWEDTRQAIGRNPQLLVLGPNTAEEIAEKGDATATKLADYLVEASVRSVGDRIRVNANLVRTKDRTEVWNKSFDRKLDDVFALQSEIAGEIEGHIRGRLAERGGKMPENIATSGEVYALYSDARAKIRKRQGDKYDEARKQLEQVVRMDPNFAPGWATLAVIKGFGFVSKEQLGTAEADARRAIALAPNLAAGHAALGFTLQKGPAAEAALRRALALDPSDFEAIHWLANSLDQSQSAERLRLYAKVVELEPLWWPAVSNRLNMLFEAGDDQAIEQERRRVEALGDTAMEAAIRIEQLFRNGDLSGAINVGLSAYRQAASEERELLTNILWGSLLALGLYDEADKVSAPMTNFVPYLRRNDPQALTMIEARMEPKQYWSFGFLPIIGTRVYMFNGRAAKIAQMYHSVARSPDQFERQLSPFMLPKVAPSVAIALRRSGEEEEAKRLLDLALTRAAESAPTGLENQVTLARIYAARGESEKALQLLSEAVRRKWLPQLPEVPSDIAEDPALAELKPDPRFERLRRQILGHLAKERAELGSISVPQFVGSPSGG